MSASISRSENRSSSTNVQVEPVMSLIIRQTYTKLLRKGLKQAYGGASLAGRCDADNTQRARSSNPGSGVDQGRIRHTTHCTRILEKLCQLFHLFFVILFLRALFVKLRNSNGLCPPVLSQHPSTPTIK